MPLVPGAPSGRRASTRWQTFSAMSWSPQEMKIFCPLTAIGPVAVRLGAACAPRRRPSPPAARSGSSSRSSRRRSSRGRIDRLQRPSGAWCSSASIWPWVSSGQSESARLAPASISPTQVDERHRQAHAAMRRVGGDADPAALGERAVGLGEARAWCAPPRSPAARRCRSPARRSGASTSSASRAASAEHRLHGLGRRLGEALGLGQPPGAEHVLEQEAHLGDAARDRSWAPPRTGRGDCGLRPARRAAIRSLSRVRQTATRRTSRTQRQPCPSANTVTLSASDRGLRAAAGLLRAGELVAFPTETVYGLGADAASEPRGRRHLRRQGPARLQPADRARRGPRRRRAARRVHRPRRARSPRRFWPGPLTLVLPRRPDAGLAALATAGLPTVALRVPRASARPAPARGLRRAARRALGQPLGRGQRRPRPRTCSTGLGGRIAAVLDGGACPLGLESTILGFDGGAPVLLRPGGLPVEALAARARPPGRARRPTAGVSAPGQLASHYAPRAPLRLDAAAAPARTSSGSASAPRPAARPGLNLSPSGDLAEAAANLFAHLRALDARAGARRRGRHRRGADPARRPRPRDQRPPGPRRRAARRRSVLAARW